MKQIIIVIFLSFHFSFASSQIPLKRKTTFQSPVISVSAHLYQIATSCENGDVLFWKTVYTNKGKSPVVAYSPTGSFVAGGMKKGKIYLWDWKENKQKGILKKHNARVTALSYSNKGDLLASADEDGIVKIWNVLNQTLLQQFKAHSKSINSISFKSNNKQIITSSKDASVKQWNKKGDLIHDFSESTDIIHDHAVSPDGKWLAAGNNSGKIFIWDIIRKKLIKTIQGHPSVASNLVFHPNSMYLISADNLGELKIWNINKKSYLHKFKAHDEKINDLEIVHDHEKNITYLLSGSEDQQLKIWDLSPLPPRYEFIIKKYAEDKIKAWQKKQLNESIDEYKKRVTARQRQKKFKEYANEATNMYALEKYDITFDSIDNYDRYHESFRMTSASLKPIVVGVPASEAVAFKNQFPKLKYSEPQFSLTDDNEFELTKLTIYNPANNKSYYFDEENKSTFSSTQLTLEAAPIKIATEVAQKEELLAEKLKKFTLKMHRENKITENVKTNVNAQAKVEKNDTGKKEINFHIEYKYQVIKAKVENQTDDFPPGEYRFSTSNAARITLQVLKESMENELIEYLHNNKKITIKITGSTDASPISGKIPYNEEYGVFRYEPYFLNNNLESITINRQTGITNNKQLAFLRTHGVRNFMENYITVLNDNQTKYQHYAELSKEKGGEHRRISIEIIIHNAFKNKEPPDNLIAQNEQSDVDTKIPENNITREHTYALVIGNEDYSSYQTGLNKEADVEYAIHDAVIFSKYLNKTFGIPEKQIKLIKNATAGQIKQGLAWINNLAKIEKGKANIIFFYSGHGMPDEETKEPYIIPVDVAGTNLEFAIKLDDVYKQLTQYAETGKVSIFIDACFSGGGKGGMLVKRKGVKIKPKERVIRGNSLIFTSSSGSQSSGVYYEKYHGYFTYFILKKIQETKGNITYKALTDYVINTVEKETALKSKIQTPQIRISPEIKGHWMNWNVIKQ